MTDRVNLPTWLKIPEKLREDREILRYLEERDFIQYQLYKKTGGTQPLPVASADFAASQQAQLNVLVARVGTNDPLTSDTTGFTVDSTKLTVDMTQSNPNTLEIEGVGPTGDTGATGPEGPEGPVGSAAWGGITGTLSDQTDLQAALDLKTFNEGDGTLLLNANVTGTPTLDAMLEVERGTEPNAILRWSESNQAWSLDQNLLRGVLDPVDGNHVGDRSYNDARYLTYSFNRLIGTGTQAVTSTLTAITWNASNDSTGADVTFSGGNPTRLTAVSAGTYKVGGYVTIQSTAQRVQTAIEIMINGVATGFQRSGTYLRNSGTAYDFWTMELSCTPFTLSASDFVELAVGQVTGATYGYSGALTVSCDRTVSEFWLERVA